MFKKLYFYFTVLMAKISIKLLRLLKKNATNFPGQVGLFLLPSILKYFKMPEKIIVVTGTNGKTTVSNMINRIFSENGYEFFSNSYGGNVDTGITSMLLENCNLNGTFDKKIALVEMDERSAKLVLPYLQPEYLVCTNLQRDSMKRNAHTEFIFDILNKYIPKKTKLILNGDDLISSQLAKGNKRAYFGINKLEDEVLTNDNLICDIVNCPKCDARLEFDFKRYNHIGRGKCPACGFGSPALDYIVTEASDGLISIENAGKSDRFAVPNNRITDFYNVTAAVAFCREFGMTSAQIAGAMTKLEIVKSRYDSFEAAGKEVIISLAKGQNPVACSGVCDFVRKEKGNKAVIMILEDLYDAKRTSENIAWIYETDFEFLRGDDIKQIIVGGKRADDYMVRLLIAGVDEDKIFCCHSESDTTNYLKYDGIDKIIIMYDLFNVESLEKIKNAIKNS